MAALDTNVLVRLIVGDDVEQLATAQDLLQEGAEQGEPLFVPTSVVLEFVWVLKSSFAYAKRDVIGALTRLLTTRGLRIESAADLEVALLMFEHANVEFADCLHVAIACQRGEQPLWTFDRAASRLEGAELLERRDVRA